MTVQELSAAPDAHHGRADPPVGAAVAEPMSAEAEAAGGRRWWVLVVIALAQLMVVLDATIVNIAMPSAQRALHISDADRQWVVTAYTLAFGGLLLLGGRVADRLGRRRTFLVGLVGFAAASALGGAATTAGLFFGARALQGVFAAVLAPSALSLLTTTFTDPRERGRAFGVYSGLAVGGAAVGLLSGGVLTQYLDWRWCLYVNVPVAVLAVIGGVAVLPRSPGHRQAGLDLPGVLLGCGGLVALVEGVTQAQNRGWHDHRVLAMLIGSGALLVLFALVEAAVRTPLLPPRVLADRNRAGAILGVSLSMVGLFGVFLFLTYYLQVQQGYSPLRTGLAFLPMTAAIMVGSTQLSARLLPRVAPRVLMVPGLLAAAGGLALLLRLSPHGHYATEVLPTEMLLGLGLGAVMMPSMSTATAGVTPRDAGVTSAAVNTAQQVGGSIGIALLNTVATSATAAYVAVHGPGEEAVLHGYAHATVWGVGILLLAALVVTVLVNAGPPQGAVTPAATEPPVAAEPEAEDEDSADLPATGPPLRRSSVLPDEPAGSAHVDAPGTADLWPPRPSSGWAAGARLSGRVVQPDGRGVAGATLTLVDPDGRQCGLTCTDRDGRYALPVPAAGTYLLVTSSPAHRPAAATVRASGRDVTADVTLTGVHALSGQVVRAADGGPVRDAAVTLLAATGAVMASAVTDTDGRFALSGLVAGNGTLAVSHPRHTAAAIPVTVGADGAPPVVVELSGRTRITGTVTAVLGRPVQDARVTLTDEAGTVLDAVTTGRDGVYGFDGLTPGRYTVTAAGYPPMPAVVAVTGRSVVRHDVRLTHPTDGPLRPGPTRPWPGPPWPGPP